MSLRFRTLGLAIAAVALLLLLRLALPSPSHELDRLSYAAPLFLFPIAAWPELPAVSR